MQNGYIKLHRQMLNWEWYDDSNTMRLFIHLLLSANHESQNWHGQEIKSGQLVTGRLKLANSLKLSEQQIRTSLNRLKSTNEITIKSTKSFSIITINKWNLYQRNNQQSNQQITNNQPTDNQQITTNKNVRMEECKNVRNNITPLPPLGEIDILLQKITNDLPLINRDKWKGLVQEWLSYKREKKQTYRSERSLRAFIKNLRNLSNDEFLKAELIINRSIGNNWSGIFALNDSTKKESEVLGECWGLT